jgi:micrococcal nuclease
MLVDVRIMPLAVVALALVACGPIDGTTTADRPMSAPGTREETTVTRVVDGDTIHVSLDGDDVTIRLIGIDTPETVAPGQPIGCFGPQASAFTTNQLTGEDVILEYDQDLIDPFGRTLAYVWFNGRLFNQTLVDRGFAVAKAYPPNTAHQAALDVAEVRARSANRGLWKRCQAA